MPAFPVRPVAAVLLGMGLGVAAVVVAEREPPIAPEHKPGWAQGAGLQPLLRPNPQAASRCAAKLYGRVHELLPKMKLHDALL